METSYSWGNAEVGIIWVSLPDGSYGVVENVDLGVIRAKCAVMAATFEYGPVGDHVSSLPAPSVDAVRRLLSYLYVDDYMEAWEKDSFSEPSFLIHLHAMHLARNFDVAGLRDVAKVNLFETIEKTVSFPNPPQDLCMAVKFAWGVMDVDKMVLKNITNYILCCFKTHGLDCNREFLQLIIDTPNFHKDLCITSIDRDFADDWCHEIMRLGEDSLLPSSPILAEVMMADACRFSRLLLGDLNRTDPDYSKTRQQRFDVLNRYMKTTYHDVGNWLEVAKDRLVQEEIARAAGASVGVTFDTQELQKAIDVCGNIETLQGSVPEIPSGLTSSTFSLAYRPKHIAQEDAQYPPGLEHTSSGSQHLPGQADHSVPFFGSHTIEWPYRSNDSNTAYVTEQHSGDLAASDDDWVDTGAPSPEQAIDRFLEEDLGITGSAESGWTLL